VLALGTDVILDNGFWSRRSREEARSRAAELGARTVLYRVSCPEDVTAKRVSRRSRDVPPDSLWMNEAAMEQFRDRFEPLGPDEDRVEVDGSERMAGLAQRG
jgi:predicted kinase